MILTINDTVPLDVPQNPFQASFPSFIIGGAAKSGTTSISRYLTQHPDIYIPSQETNFFTYAGSTPKYQVINHNFINDIDTYSRLLTPPVFPSSNIHIGEKSVSYLYKGYHENVIQNIKIHHPTWKSLKWIFILRQPTLRAYSQYIHNLNFYENKSFTEAVELWPKRKAEGWIPAYDYIGAGFYSVALRAYQKHFANVRVYLFEDLQYRPEWLINDLLKFLGIQNRNQNFNFTKYNSSGIPRNVFIRKGLSILRGSNNRPDRKAAIGAPGKDARLKLKLKQLLYYKPAIPAGILNEVSLLFEKEIHNLEEVLQRDLSGWHFHKDSL